MTDIVSPPTINALPPAPQPADTPAEFDGKAFALLAAQVAMVGDFNSAAAATQQNATAANERAVAAASSASAANGSASTASIQAGVASGAATTAIDKAAEAVSAAGLAVPAAASASADAAAVALALAQIAGGPVASINGKTGVVTLTKSDLGLDSVDNTADNAKAVLSASKLTTARTINGVSFDGTVNVAIPGNPAVVTATGGVMNCALGDYFSLTVSGATTLSFTNIPSGSYACVLEINHTAGAITLPAGSVWVGTAPTLATGKRHLIFFQRAQLGTAGWYVSALAGYPS